MCSLPLIQLFGPTRERQVDFSNFPSALALSLFTPPFPSCSEPSHAVPTTMAPSIPPYLPVAESYKPTHPELFRIIFAKGDFASSLITVAVSNNSLLSFPLSSTPIHRISVIPRPQISISHYATFLLVRALTDSLHDHDSHSPKEIPSASSKTLYPVTRHTLPFKFSRIPSSPIHSTPLTPPLESYRKRMTRNEFDILNLIRIYYTLIILAIRMSLSTFPSKEFGKSEPSLIYPLELYVCILPVVKSSNSGDTDLVDGR